MSPIQDMFSKDIAHGIYTFKPFFVEYVIKITGDQMGLLAGAAINYCKPTMEHTLDAIAQHIYPNEIHKNKIINILDTTYSANTEGKFSKEMRDDLESAVFHMCHSEDEFKKLTAEAETYRERFNWLISFASNRFSFFNYQKFWHMNPSIKSRDMATAITQADTLEKRLALVNPLVFYMTDIDNYKCEFNLTLFESIKGEFMKAHLSHNATQASSNPRP